jgi:hypothetical protein
LRVITLLRAPALTHQFHTRDYELSLSRHLLSLLRIRTCAACTFLGPSRKRGPPKGYIDAIEARLHQTEALLGVLLAVEAEHGDTCVWVTLYSLRLAEDLYRDEVARGRPRKDSIAGLDDVLNTLRKVRDSPFSVLRT